MNLINLWRDLNNENSVNDDEFINNTRQIEPGENNTNEVETNKTLFSLIFAASHSIAMTSGKIFKKLKLLIFF
jgi:hypothetical protein